ncbi:MAG: SDR family NAD(P)-dependent oxidoreductase [Acidobacteriota bacterium]
MNARKTILITGSTDGIGLETARALISLGHRVLLHGRGASKLEAVQSSLASIGAPAGAYVADLSRMADVEALAAAVTADRDRLDVLINNAGVYGASDPLTADGLDVRFAVNTLAPYLLTRRLAPLLGSDARVVNLSSAAQSPVDPEALAGPPRLSDDAAYAQSKLALTMWSRHLAISLGEGGPVVVAVNPGSLLGTKMVRQAYGVSGGDVAIGADVLARAALDDAFAGASGQYFDNDSGRFAPPHPDGLDARKCRRIVDVIEEVLVDAAGIDVSTMPGV